MNIALIDDSFEDMDSLVSHIKKYFKKKHVNLPICIKRFQDEEQFLNSYGKYHYEIIFIDYYLNHLTGLELAKKIRVLDSTAVLIFTTVSRDFAIDSYRVKASGYLVKPIEYHDFEEIMELVNCRKLRENEFINVINGQAEIKILLKDIVYCDVSGHYTQIHTKDMNMIKCRQSFSDFVTHLAAYPEFLVCYRGCIINMQEVKKVDELFFLMSNGDQIPLRVKQKTAILNQYSEYLFEKNREGNFR